MSGGRADQDQNENEVDQNDAEWRSHDQNENPKKRRRRSKRQDDEEGGGGGGGGDGDDDDDDGEWGKIPYEIIAKTTGVAVRLGLSHDQQLIYTAAILKCSGVDLTNYPLSHSTTVRRRKEVLGDTFEGEREAFRQTVVEREAPVFIHTDTKELRDSIGPHGAAVTNKKWV